jgi:hypothetical protein
LESWGKRVAFLHFTAFSVSNQELKKLESLPGVKSFLLQSFSTM